MSNQLENAILGCLIAQPDLLPIALTKITPRDFLDPKCEAVMMGLVDMWTTDTPVDPLSVSTYMQDSKTQVSGMDIIEMVQVACLPEALPHHLSTVADRAAVRRLGQAGEKIAMLASQETAPQVVAQHAQELLDGAVRTDDSKIISIGDKTQEMFDRAEKAAAGEVDAGLPSGFPDLDDMIGGFRGGQMTIIAARPGVGKSALAVDFMRHASIKMGVPSLMFSLEMSALELNQRVMAAESSVNLGRIIDGNLSQEEWAALGDTAERISKAPLYVDESADATMMDIVAKARMWVQQHNVGLIVVDYLQLLRQDGQQSREQEVATYSRAMKMLAKSCNVPVIVLSQLNRDSVKHNRKPQVSDLRESGALEQDADVVMLMWRPDAENADHERAGEMELIVGKNRHGRTGEVVFAHQLHYSRFVSMVRG